MDLQTIGNRLREGDYYRSKEAMLADLHLMVTFRPTVTFECHTYAALSQIRNCRLFNEDGSAYCDCAIGVEKLVNELFSSKEVQASASLTDSGAV
jgi:hypothetical protein